ncbi:MAG: phosphoenolpyruvate synthase, partial [uncultured bacterium]
MGEPDLAEEIAKRNVDGVGLLRAEFMIANIGTHPKKLIKDKQSHVFVNQLAEG